MHIESDSPVPFLVKVGGAFFLSGLIIGALAWGVPQFGVYNRTLAGKAALMEAESTRQVRVLEAKAKMDSASLEARPKLNARKA